MRGVARVLALLAKYTNASIYRSIVRNLILVNPSMSDNDRQKLATDALCQQMISTADSLKSWAMSPDWSIGQIVRVHHIDVFQNGLENPNGMLAIVPHIGTWEIDRKSVV